MKSTITIHFSFSSNEVKSPGDWIAEEQVMIGEENVVLEIEDATWSTFTDTNSMDPVIDKGSHAIKLVPKDDSELSIGDIVSYESPNGVIIHRIVDVREDDEGLFYVMKGDNNDNVDSQKVRFVGFCN